MYIIQWEYEVKRSHEAEFVRAYGPEGDWAQLFRRAQGYLGTTLLPNPKHPGRYETIDHWRSQADFEAFQTQWQAEYSALDERTAGWTDRETRLLDYVFQPSDELTATTIESMHDLLVALYPDFAPYYERNRFYSTVKPQMVLHVHADGRLVASAKFLWRDIALPDGTPLRLCAVGLLIDAAYQGRGIAKTTHRLFVNAGRERHINLLYGTTKNPATIATIEHLGGRLITTKVMYTDATSHAKEIVQETGLQPYGYGLTEGIVEHINQQPFLDIGIGPV